MGRSRKSTSAVLRAFVDKDFIPMKSRSTTIKLMSMTLHLYSNVCLNARYLHLLPSGSSNGYFYPISGQVNHCESGNIRQHFSAYFYSILVPFLLSYPIALQSRSPPLIGSIYLLQNLLLSSGRERDISIFCVRCK